MFLGGGRRIKELVRSGARVEFPPATIPRHPPTKSSHCHAATALADRPHPRCATPPRPSPPFQTMARATALVGALVIGASLLAGTPAAAPTGSAAAAGRDLADASRGVQVLTLEEACDSACQADTVARVEAAGCDAVRLFPTLRMASARCAAGSSGGGISAQNDGAGAVDLSRLPGVQSVSPDAVMTFSSSAGESGDATAASVRQLATWPPWGLDRINQEALPLDNITSMACYPARGAGVTVYVLDSGIAAGHEHFGGRASGVVAPGAQINTFSDMSGHGSHVAGTIAGKWTGVAPAATVVGVRVIKDDRTGTVVDVISAIEYVAAIKAASRRSKIVMNMSIGFPMAHVGAKQVSTAAGRAARTGVIAVTSAGNDGASAGRNHPASSPEIITVAASTRTDRLATISSRGECVNVSAPGENILSVFAFGTEELTLMNGTSTAAPHVAGLAALILAEDPEWWDLENEDVLQAMTRDAPTVGGFPLAWANPSCVRATAPARAPAMTVA